MSGSEASRPEAMQALLAELGAEYGQWRGCEVVESYGDWEAEYGALRDPGAVAVADRLERETLALWGEDCVPWLQGLCTNDVFQLAEEGSGQLTQFVNNLGRVITDGRLLHVPEVLVLDLECGVLRGDGFQGYLRRYVVTEKVVMRDATARTAHLGVFGERAAALLQELTEPAHRLSGRAMWDGSWGRIVGLEVILQRVPLVGEAGFDVTCERAAAPFVMRAILEAAGEGGRPVGHRALEVARLEAGVVRFGAETGERVIPVEADLNHAIDYDKGCYVGQEIIHRLDTKGRPAKFLRELVPGEPGAPVPRIAAPVREGGKTCGEVASAAWSPGRGAPVIWAWLKRGHYEEEGREVEVEVGEGAWLGARVAPLGAALASKGG